jgi:hypothetical protein
VYWGGGGTSGKKLRKSRVADLIFCRWWRRCTTNVIETISCFLW